jgi:glyoxylase-like metal-dependent hydrolase (beta-lactamase superfamily II)
MPDRSKRALAPYPGDVGPLPDGIHRISLPTPFPIGRVNCYLLEGSPLTLVDCGINTGTALDALETALAELGHTVEQLELVVLTHEHIDHVGLATIIARRAACPLAAYAPLQVLWDPEQSAGDVLHARISWATSQIERHGYPHEVAVSSQAVLFLASGYGSRPQVDQPLLGGDVLRAGDRDWDVLYRPGHSVSDLVFVDRASGTALCGDHLLSATSPNPTLTAPLEIVRPDETTERVHTLPLYLDSVARTAADGLELLLPGHGPTIGPPGELIAKRQTFHERRSTKIAAMLGQEPKTVFELAMKMWKGVPVIQPHLTFSEVIGHLDLLVTGGRASEVAIDDRVVGFVATA